MHAMNRQMLFNRKILLLSATLALSGCTLGTDTSQPSTMAIVSGDSQTAPVNTALPDSLSVIVVGSFYEPIGNETVTWTVLSGGGSVNPLTSQTNANGVAWTRYTAGASPGAVKIQAKVSSLPAIFFDVSVTP
ncbi:MAG: hypothetical protein JWL97_632 [Gemmatimonadales bacterium]|nr:hypothetical protein [Gemmatimonadales bacterium]